jgi:hypothetical protein
MKTLTIIAICAIFSLGFLRSGAQEKLPINQPNYNKPKVFDDLPGKMNLTISDMESLFDLSVGTPVTAKLTQNFHFKGTVVSKSGNSESQVQSVVINSLIRKGAVFTFTRITREDGSLIYRGRILNKESIDAYEIVKENDQYVLEKKNYYEMVRE